MAVPLVRESPLPAAPSNLSAQAASRSGGVFKSINGGGSWSAFSAGLTNPFTQALAIGPETPASLPAGTHGNGAFDIQRVELQYRTYLPLILRGQ